MTDPLIESLFTGKKCVQVWWKASNQCSNKGTFSEDPDQKKVQQDKG